MLDARVKRKGTMEFLLSERLASEKAGHVQPPTGVDTIRNESLRNNPAIVASLGAETTHPH